jgi:hypothetical protein
LNRSLSFDDSFNILSRLNLDYGRRWRSLYFFGAISWNYFLRETEESEGVYPVNSVKLSTGELFELNGEFWPGYAIGIQF